MRSTGTEQPVLALKLLKDRRAKGLRHSGGFMGQPRCGGDHEFDKSV